ncbi:hypothetical protein BDB01DRAFT_718658 [Pilobolus umbonatus]|nr:hypothetical protein BDB01DRAFT_718658 [Pilobolus umbonatus]
MSIYNPTVHGGQPRQQDTNRGVDIETVRRNYRTALSELTFNSKPIITNLTIMAQENQRAASIIVREIENQLRNNAAGQKLPVLYLIDSICKNVGGVYITNFGRNMVNVFLDAYTLTDPSVRKSFEKLLQTWKNGMPGEKPVFPRHIIEPIERSINYIREKTHTSRYPHLPVTANKNTTNQQIHVNPNFVKKDTLNTRDPRNRPPVSPQLTETVTMQPNQLLSQLQMALPSNSNISVTNDPVSQIISQINAILPTLPPSQATSIQQYLSRIAPPIPASTPSPPITHLAYPVISTPPLAASAFPSPTTVSPAVDTADLLKSLTSLGYLTTSSSVPIKEPSSTSVTSSSKVLDLNQLGPFILDSKELQIPRPGAIELLYSAEPLQCKQCGFRYPKTEKGQAKMDAHLDSHFRQNRKMKERVKRGLSRSWFVTIDEWVNGEGGELTSQQAPTFLHDGIGHSNKSNEKNSASIEESINPEEFTVIMPNEDRKPCPICGERFVDFWNDDEEEWMFRNAILVDNKIYHATCHADAIKSNPLENEKSNKRKLEEDEEVSL